MASMKWTPNICLAPFAVLCEALVVLFGQALWVRSNRPNTMDEGAKSRVSYFILFGCGPTGSADFSEGMSCWWLPSM